MNYAGFKWLRSFPGLSLYEVGTQYRGYFLNSVFSLGKYVDTTRL